MRGQGPSLLYIESSLRLRPGGFSLVWAPRSIVRGWAVTSPAPAASPRATAMNSLSGSSASTARRGTHSPANGTTSCAPPRGTPRRRRRRRRRDVEAAPSLRDAFVLAGPPWERWHIAHELARWAERNRWSRTNAAPRAASRARPNSAACQRDSVRNSRDPSPAGAPSSRSPDASTRRSRRCSGSG